MDVTMAGPLQPNHPYYPQTALIPHYQENESSLVYLLACFGLLLAAVALVSVKLASMRNSCLTTVEKFSVAWYSICFFLHCFFEGYFICHYDTLAGRQSLFGQLWKEYSLSDSRYLTSDPFMLAVESITVVIWGPLCFAAVVCIAQESIVRHPIQGMVCVAHLYGVILYYGTCFADSYFRGVSHSRPEFLYFWVYYVGCNIPWVIVPTILLVRSIRATRLAFGTLMGVHGLVYGIRFKIDCFNEAQAELRAAEIADDGGSNGIASASGSDNGDGGQVDADVDLDSDVSSSSRLGYVDLGRNMYADNNSDRDSGIGSS